MTKPFGDRKWDQRIERARELAGQYSFAAEVLTFYSKLAAFQKAINSHLQAGVGSTTARSLGGKLAPELSAPEIKVLMQQVRPFLSFLRREGSSAMTDFAARHEKIDPADWARLLMQFWRRNVGGESGSVDGGLGDLAQQEVGLESPDGDLRRFIALAVLQPYAEHLAHRADIPVPIVRTPDCPFCGSKPLAGVLRPEGEGAKRSLICSFCYTEWDYLRIACPACQETRDEKMCVYSAAKFELVRVEACETCKAYIKTVDLTKNGRAIPEVDELGAIPLTLWADEQGYTKISRNIFNS